jgi:hypothetical protein
MRRARRHSIRHKFLMQHRAVKAHAIGAASQRPGWCLAKVADGDSPNLE